MIILLKNGISTTSICKIKSPASWAITGAPDWLPASRTEPFAGHVPHDADNSTPIKNAEGMAAPASGRQALHFNGVSDVRLAAIKVFVKK